jgi:hypothetical protein
MHCLRPGARLGAERFTVLPSGARGDVCSRGRARREDGLEINASRCRGCRGGAHRRRCVVIRLVRVGLPVWQDDDASYIAEFGGERD